MIRDDLPCVPRGAVGDLVRAAALEPDRALRAWSRCRPELHTIGPIRDKFLPGVYSNLNAATDDPMLHQLGELHKRTWMWNELMVSRAAHVVELLRNAGISVVVMKGAALALLYYRDLGARVMSDVDLLVGPEKARAAVDVLEREGWREWIPKEAPTGPLKYGFHVEHPTAGTLDLHEYALAQSADDSDFWSDAVPFRLGNLETLTLAPTDQLLHVCIHGLRWVPVGPTAWIVDAMKILRGRDVDWERLIDRARARRLTTALAFALRHLQTGYGAEVPADAIGRLGRIRAPLFERAAHRALMRRPNTVRFGLAAWDRYRRFSLLAAPQYRPSSFADFLRSGWALGDRGLVRQVIGKVVSRNYRDLVA